MRTYKVEFVFNDIDNSLYTDSQACVVIEIRADDYTTAILVANRMEKVLGSDHYTFVN